MRLLFLLPLVFLLDGVQVAETGPVPGAGQRVRTNQDPVVWIPGGWFTRGSNEADVRHAVDLCLIDRVGLSPAACPPELFIDETPRQRVWVSAYGMDRTEVTQRAYRRCVTANRCPPPRVSDADDRMAASSHPVVGVTWSEARAYCAYVDGRLPTEAEWERAARGSDLRRFPWGRHYNPRLANHGRAGRRPDGVDGYRYAAPVGSYYDGRSPFGLLDMAGNVWEWTADLYGPETHLGEARIDPRGASSGGERIVRGGSWRFPAYTLRVTNRARLPEAESWPDVGIRCAYTSR